MSDLKQGDSLPELRVTPDACLTKRYAEASGDSNPIHIDPEFAKSVGLPGAILHGLYSMAQVARAHTEAAGGDPRALKRLSVQFRGMGFPEQEIVVSATVKESSDGRIVTDTVAAQGDNRIIRNAEAELELRLSDARERGDGPIAARGLESSLEHALRAPAADPQSPRRRLPRVREAGRLEGDRRARGHRVEPLDRARRARGARARRLSDPPAYLGGPPAHRLRLSLLRGLAARVGAPPRGAARAQPGLDPDAPPGGRGDARDDRRAVPDNRPARPRDRPSRRHRAASIASRCCCCSPGS